MKDIHLCLERVLHQIRANDETLHKTYALVQDPKIFIPLLEKIKSAFLELIEILLKHKGEKKGTVDANVVKFFAIIAPSYGLSPTYAKSLEEINTIFELHKTSKTEFSRHGSLVLCTEEFKIVVIEPKSIQNYINLSKHFYTAVEKIVL